jgi:10 TM Acyl Transferase domain found in Cas1p
MLRTRLALPFLFLVAAASAAASSLRTDNKCFPAFSSGQPHKLVVLGDSVFRYLIFDFVSTLYSCKPEDARPICTLSATARGKRDNYDFTLESTASFSTPLKIHFRSATVARNITHETWYPEAVAAMKEATAGKDTTVLFSIGLWNLRYDQPREEVPQKFLAELTEVFKGISESLSATGAKSGNLFWRTITPVESSLNPDFPPGYDSSLIQRTNALTTPLALQHGFHVIDISEALSKQQQSQSQAPSGFLTTDGTHFSKELNAKVMSAIFSEICNVASASSSSTSTASASGPRATQAPPQLIKVSTLPSANGLPSTGAAAAKLPLSVVFFTLAITVFGLVWLFRHHQPVSAALQTTTGIAVAFVAVCTMVFLFDVASIFPRVTKDRAIGSDMQFGIFTIILFLALITFKESKKRGGSAGAGGAAASAVAATPISSTGAAAVPVPSPITSPPPVESPPPASRSSSSANGSTTGGSAGHSEDAFMSLDLTNEFKGLCMSFFLLYHYWDVKTVYNPVRVMVAAFLFLTGYGNFLSLSLKGPSWHKFCLSFIRINLLVALLMATVAEPYMLYYICPLHTFWTAVVYGFFVVLPNWHPHNGSSSSLAGAAATNGTGGTAPSVHNDEAALNAIAPWRVHVNRWLHWGQEQGKMGTRKGVLAKLVALTVILLLLFELPLIEELLSLPLYPLLHYKGSLYEWCFRSKLDAYAPLTGMWVAYFKPEIVRILDEVNKRGKAAVIGTGALLLGIMIAHGFACYPMAKAQYNASHRFTAIVPLVIYLPLRNLTPWLSARYCGLFAALGKASLDFYLLQFHLWLSNNSKTIINIFGENGYPFSSFVLQTAIFGCTAWGLAQAQEGLLKRLAEASKARLTLGLAAGLGVVLALISSLTDTSGKR